MGQFSPDKGEIFGIKNGLHGWTSVNGFGPSYFLSPTAEAQLLAFIQGGTCDEAALKKSLSEARASVLNSFALLTGDGDYKPVDETKTMADAETFLKQLKEQLQIWRTGTFKSLDFSRKEIEVLSRVWAKALPALFLMGFADSIPHSSQVARLAASMAHSLDGRHSEILQAAIVGSLHDPKFEPKIDVAKQNLATHPINAAALADCVFEDEAICSALAEYFHKNQKLTRDFVEGIIDALGVNDDSWFVQMQVILPNFVKLVGDKYGSQVAAGFKSVMEARLQSASAGTCPPPLPPHLHGCLAQETLDSGLRGVSGFEWKAAVVVAGVACDDAGALFRQLTSGQLGTVTQEQIGTIRRRLRSTPGGVLSARISATRLLHHHQEVIPSGRIASAALVVADPMMLSPHKVAAVYSNTLVERLQSFCKSFDDNIRLLPRGARGVGLLWQRAVYMSMLLASDKLTGSQRLAQFKTDDAAKTGIPDSIAALQKLVLDPATWGTYATAAGAGTDGDIGKALKALEEAYRKVVDDYRDAVQDGTQPLAHFFPKP